MIYGAPACTTLRIQQFLTKNDVTPVLHPSYSPDLTLRDYFLFPQVKKVLKGKHFADVEEVKQKMAQALKGIKIHEFKTVFSSGKNILIGVLHQMESTLKVTEV